jgi:hypothetical protein
MSPMCPVRTKDELERAMGFEPTTPTLARLCSTPKLLKSQIRLLTIVIIRSRFVTLFLGRSWGRSSLPHADELRRASA